MFYSMICIVGICIMAGALITEIEKGNHTKIPLLIDLYRKNKQFDLAEKFLNKMKNKLPETRQTILNLCLADIYLETKRKDSALNLFYECAMAGSTYAMSKLVQYCDDPVRIYILVLLTKLNDNSQMLMIVKNNNIVKKYISRKQLHSKMGECEICTNSRLLVLRECGHMHCEQCYLRIVGKCPFCRL